jgi:hypothetical protein
MVILYWLQLFSIPRSGATAFADARGVPSGGITELVQMQSCCYRELLEHCQNVRHLPVSRHSADLPEK